jgi:hypothetical protein
VKAWTLACALAALAVPACTRHKVELDVKPIHITMDVNIRVQRELDSIFDEIEGEAETPPASEPKAEEKPKAEDQPQGS